MSVDAILSQAEELTLEQRAELLRRLEAGLHSAGWQPETEISEYVANLLDERMRTSDANPQAGVPFEVAWEAARKRWGK